MNRWEVDGFGCDLDWLFHSSQRNGEELGNPGGQYTKEKGLVGTGKKKEHLFSTKLIY